MQSANPDQGFLRALFKLAEATPDVAWVFCPDDHAPLMLNQLARVFFPGQPTMADLRTQWRMLVHPDDHQAVPVMLAGATEQGHLYPLKFRFKRADTGRYAWFEGVFSPVLRVQHVTRQWFVRAADIDARLNQEQALREAARRKDAFIALLGHELRNPLAPIRTSLALIRAAQPSALILSEVELIERQTSQMVRLIDDLLDMARLDHDRLTLVPERFDLRSSVWGIRDMVLRTRHDMHARLTVSLPDSPVMVMADRVRIKQVLGNLMRNAVTYSGPGSPVSLSLAVTAQHEAQITLTDAGIGINPERLDAIFEPFSRAPEDARRPNEGLGLGLTLARRLVQMQGGRLEAYSAGLGRGSTFTITLPLDARAEHDAPTARPASPAPVELKVADVASPSGLSILVVDDSAQAADSLTLLLQRWGYAAHAAYDGRSALALEQTLQPDAIILDIDLPDMSGYDLARVLRDRQGSRDLAIIALSGYRQTEQAPDASPPLFDQYYLKPVDLERFRLALDTHSTPAG
jgi:signal transduction histidine kinase/ActR/RegA family two-component response regulator